MAKKKEMSQRGKDALRAALVQAFERAADDPQIRDFGDACCLVIGSIGYLADSELDMVALWRELRVDRAVARVSLSEKLAKLTLADDVRQLTTDDLLLAQQTLSGNCACDEGRPWDCDNHNHDRECCDCGACENWRLAEETH